MSDSRVAVGTDRLPWLADEPRPRQRRGERDLTAWAVAATALVAGASYWMGTQSVIADREPRREMSTPATTTTTVPLPEPRQVAPPPQVRIEPQPEVTPAPEPEVRPLPAREIEAAPARRATAAKPKPSRASKARKERAARSSSNRQTAARPSAARSQTLTPWPARTTAGAYGRLVQIGAFGSRQQAKLGWRRMVRAYPAVGRLRAVVVETRNSRGRPFYRFQIGTTSQAHSEVLCQRMQRIRFSCAVVGLPWKPRGVER